MRLEMWAKNVCARVKGRSNPLLNSNSAFYNRTARLCCCLWFHFECINAAILINFIDSCVCVCFFFASVKFRFRHPINGAPCHFSVLRELRRRCITLISLHLKQAIMWWCVKTWGRVDVRLWCEVGKFHRFIVSLWRKNVKLHFLIRDYGPGSAQSSNTFSLARLTPPKIRSKHKPPICDRNSFL